MGPVVDADGAPLGGTLLIEVDANAVAAPDDFAGIHAVAAQGVDSGLADGVGGQLGDVGHIHAVIGQGDGHVGLAAAEGEFQVVGLDKALVVVGLEANHQFAKGYDFSHNFLPPA